MGGPPPDRVDGFHLLWFPAGRRQPGHLEAALERCRGLDSEAPSRVCEPLDSGVILKIVSYRPGRRLRALRRMRRLSNEAKHLQELSEQGLAPAPLVLGVRRRWGILQQVFLLLERLPDCSDLRVVLGEYPPGSSERRLALQLAGELALAMHRQGGYHRDLFVRNVLIDLESRRAWLIDCPRAERSRLRLRSRYLRRADLYRLIRSAWRWGATGDELRLLCSAAGVEDPAALLSLLDCGRNSLRGRLFTWFGWVSRQQLESGGPLAAPGTAAGRTGGAAEGGDREAARAGQVAEKRAP